MELNKTKDKVLIISKGMLESEEGRYGACLYLQSIMLYPDDEDNLLSHYHSLLRAALEVAPINARKEFIEKQSELVTDLLSEQADNEKTLMGTAISRKSKGFSRAARAVLSGQILFHLLGPGGQDTLEYAYSNIIKSFENASPEIIDLCSEKGRTLPSPPSKSALKAAWKEFKNVSHLWAADFVTTLKSKQPILSIENIPTEKQLTIFLQIASFLRVELISKDKASTSTPLIKKPMDIWDIRDDNQKQFPPQSIFT